MNGFNNIAVVGLGLIGGSMCKTISNRTDCKVYGMNRTMATCQKAKEEGAVYGILGEDAELSQMDLIILGLYPDGCIDFVKGHISEFKKGAVITDCCGTKQKICNALYELCKQNDLYFIGGHPMAGIEKSGYDYSFDGLFDHASMILCKLNEEPVLKAESADFERAKENFVKGNTETAEGENENYAAEYDRAYDSLKQFFINIGFGFVKESSPSQHDRVIAYTSQMAHVVSSAYIKSEACKTRYGFSAGSFKDMTRVAFLNETMWTELFLENRDCLLHEMEEFMEHMQEYHDALENRDEEMLCKLLKEGRLCKTADIESENEQLKKQKAEEE